jgi:hypothetical protein
MFLRKICWFQWLNGVISWETELNKIIDSRKLSYYCPFWNRWKSYCGVATSSGNFRWPLQIHFYLSSSVNFPSIHETNFSDYINISSISECVVGWKIQCLTSSEPYCSDDIPDLIMEDRSAIPFVTKYTCYRIILRGIWFLYWGRATERL